MQARKMQNRFLSLFCFLIFIKFLLLNIYFA
jgi:hypothetical protein